MQKRTSPVVRVSYPHVFIPKTDLKGVAKYEISLMFSKTNPEHKSFVKLLHADCQKALEAKFPDPATRPRTPIIGGLKSPIKDADVWTDANGIPVVEKTPDYAGHWIIRAATLDKIPLVGPNREAILDKSVVYGGSYCKVNLNAYGYSGTESKGVSFGLNGVQFIKDGPFFGQARMSVDAMFSAENGSDDPGAYDQPETDPFA